MIPKKPFPQLASDEEANNESDPPHPGLALKLEIDVRGVTIAEAASCLDVPRSTLVHIIKGRSGIKPLMALRLELAGLGPAHEWTNRQLRYILPRVRRKMAVHPRQPRRVPRADGPVTSE